MEFPSDFIDADEDLVNQSESKNHMAPASPTSPIAPIARYSTAPPVSAAPNRASTFAQPRSNGAKPSVTRSATVSGNKSNRLTRTFSRMFGKGAPRPRPGRAGAAAAEPVPELKSEDKTAIEPISETTAPAEADKKSETKVTPPTTAVAAETSAEVKPSTADKTDAEEPAQDKEDAHKTTLDQPASTEAAKPEAQTDAPALQPIATKSTVEGEAPAAQDFEKSRKIPPPVQTDPALVAELAKLENLGSPLSIRISEENEKSGLNGAVTEAKTAADAAVKKQKKKVNTGFFSIFRMKRKNNNLAPQVAAN